MKSTIIKYLGLFVFAILPAFSFAALIPGKVQVGKITGNVMVVDTKTNQRKPLVSGQVIQEGATVETSADSSVELIFSNGSTIVLTPETVVELRTFRQLETSNMPASPRTILKEPSPSVTDINVKKGKIAGEVRELNSLSAFSIKIPDGMVRASTSVFSIDCRDVSGSVGNTAVSNIAGSLDVSFAGNNVGSVAVAAGMQVSHGAGTSASKVFLYPIPAEELTAISNNINAASTLPVNVTTTITSLAQKAPNRSEVFPNNAKEPVSQFAKVITEQSQTNKPTDTSATNVSNVPGIPSALSSTSSSASGVAPSSTSSPASGGGTSVPQFISNILNSTVERQQVNQTPTGN